MFEFHISKDCREKYRFDSTLFQLNGNVIFADLHAVKNFAHKLNIQRKKEGKNLLLPAELHAMGIIDEILHFVLQKYQKEKNPFAFEYLLKYLNSTFGEKVVLDTIKKFIKLFPPRPVYEKLASPTEYLKRSTDGMPNTLITLQEMLMLSLANGNPAFLPFVELFDEEPLKKNSEYSKVILEIEKFFETQPRYGPYNQTIVELLKSPSRASPYSLAGQLQYIKEHWRLILTGELMEGLLMRILVSLDFIREETKQRPLGKGPNIVPEIIPGTEIFQELEHDRPGFSPDTDWMPKVVMIVKHTYVWLYQLSKKYQRDVKRLDQIPEEELKMLSERGFNALWLIGIWERSKASAQIKKICGNPEAIASAYSIYDYEVSQALGGEEAFNNLKQKAFAYNIRIAVDMVPNHTAIDSRWIKEHPDWFIQRDDPPFFDYRFSGPNLSLDPELEIYIEDGYYNRTNAAVVFKLVEKRTGRTRYIYHGNDGTSTPWNDTAQLNFLLPEVREAVIKKIIDIARKSSIIRLDAAMTLTKKHFHRLWFPEPGRGGDIPSRTEYSMTNREFNKNFPKEFWREVVDRVNGEVPDTLLLAEAFWLMEGYFVRNLGMHRVYNSAFMNMLKMEQNKEYHQLLKNIYDYDPNILARFVNFMSNPDELTAVQQFGKDDKYFGVCIMMVTMPGLCMFGHGQIEGFQEKYGMEYQRSYWEEKVDDYLVKRHEQEIFPLLRKRHFFSGIENFRLYDFYDVNNQINENVFVYSNGKDNEYILVVYNNRYQETQGWIRGSARYHTRDLCQGLHLNCQKGIFYLCRDHKDGLYYLINPAILSKQGWYLELGAYKYHIFMEFKEIKDNQNQDYARLFKFLNNRGVPDINRAIAGMEILHKTAQLKPTIELHKIIKNDHPLLPLIQKIVDNPAAFQEELLYTPLISIIEKADILLDGVIEPVKFFDMESVKTFILLHNYENIEWFNKERFELLLSWIIINKLTNGVVGLDRHLLKMKMLLERAAQSGYQYKKFLSSLT
ncbi:MAG: alpha-amylase family glycosyl hydrolase [bacterium]